MLHPLLVFFWVMQNENELCVHSAMGCRILRIRSVRRFLAAAVAVSISMLMTLKFNAVNFNRPAIQININIIDEIGIGIVCVRPIHHSAPETFMPAHKQQAYSIKKEMRKKERDGKTVCNVVVALAEGLCVQFLAR